MNAKRAALAVLTLLLLIGGVIYGKEGEEQREDDTGKGLLTETRGGTAAYGRSTGIDGSASGIGEYQELLQECMGRRKAASSAVQGTMAAAAKAQPAVSRSGDSINRASNYVASLGTFKITAYTAGFESTGKRPGDKGYGKVAISGSKRANFQPVYVEEGVTAAADWEVLPPGTVIYIDGLGTRTVQDRGGAVKGNHIDIYIPELEKALEWGVQRLEVHVIKWGE